MKPFFGHAPKNRPFGLEKEVRTESGILIVVGRGIMLDVHQTRIHSENPHQMSGLMASYVIPPPLQRPAQTGLFRNAAIPCFQYPPDPTYRSPMDNQRQ